MGWSSGPEQGWGTGRAGEQSHRDQPTLSFAHGLSNVQKALYRELIHQNLPTGAFLQEKQFLPALLSVTLPQQLRGWNQGIAGDSTVVQGPAQIRAARLLIVPTGAKQGAIKQLRACV